MNRSTNRPSYVSLDVDEAYLAMSERVRKRQRRTDDPRTGEDVMSQEPDMDFSGAGPHAPMFYHASRRRDDDSDDDEQPLMDDDKSSEDSNLSWFARTRASLKGDVSSILLLLFLYLLQGIPLGLIAAIPLILMERHVSYGQQAIFSFAYWPFSLKLLWAPIVDAVYCRRIGRRKSWMVPCQYLIGIFMLILSWQVPYIMGDELNPPNVLFLMFTFLPLNFLAATQDIAVDGWALTILSRKNVGYASTCNAVGQTAGFFMGNVMFLALQSPNFANTFRGVDDQKPYGFIDLAGFLFFWGCVFVISTTLVFIFKKEVDHSVEQNQENEEDAEVEMGIVETYGVLWKILRLKPMIYMLIILLTGKLAFAATDGVTGLKLILLGIPKDKLAGLGVFLTPLQCLLPWLIGKWTTGPRPLNIFLVAYPYRLFIGGVFAALVWWTPSFQNDDGSYQMSVYVVWILAYIFHQVATYSMFVSMMAFNAQISDPRIGGTYMTLLNTINNLGGNWPVTLVLWLTDKVTWKDCVVKGTKTIMYACHKKEMADQCSTEGHVCETNIDGYYVALVFCTVFGIIWYNLLFKKVKYVQKIPRSEWRVIKSNK